MLHHDHQYPLTVVQLLALKINSDLDYSLSHDVKDLPNQKQERRRGNKVANVHFILVREPDFTEKNATKLGYLDESRVVRWPGVSLPVKLLDLVVL